MSFIAKDPHGGEIPIPMDETLTALKKTLPKDHPLVAQVKLCFENARGVIADHMEHGPDPEAPNFEDVLDRLTRQLSDWRSGIRDWDEVEPELTAAQKACEWVPA